MSYHSIPENKKKSEAAHYHHDICFLFCVPDDTPFVISDESNDLKWFSMEDLKALISNDERGKNFYRFLKKWEQFLASKAA